MTDPLIGAEVLSGLVRNRQAGWEGRLFVPDLNKHSKVSLRSLGQDESKITGCAIGRLVCESEVWTRFNDR